MKPRERYLWLAKWAKLHGNMDVLNADLVADYIDATGAKFAMMMYGADKCRQLGTDLSRMASLGYLTRHRTGLEGLAGMGFPRWVWVYARGENINLLEEQP